MLTFQIGTLHHLHVDNRLHPNTKLLWGEALAVLVDRGITEEDAVAALRSIECRFAISRRGSVPAVAIGKRHDSLRMWRTFVIGVIGTMQ